MEGFSFNMLFTQFGYFNSDLAFAGLRQSPHRIVQNYEFEVTAEDGGVSFIDGETVPVRAGMVMIARPGMERYTVLPLKNYYLKLPPEDSPMVRLLSSLPTWYSSAYVDLYRSCIERMIYAQTIQDRWLESSELFRLFSYLQDEKKQLAFLGDASGTEIRIIGQALAYMKQNLSKKCTLAEIAESVHMSPFYFHTVFRRLKGETPQVCLNRLRIEKAVELLLTSDQEIRSIAEECGFSSQSYFTEVFRKYMNMTPRVYRIRMMRKYI